MLSPPVPANQAYKASKTQAQVLLKRTSWGCLNSKIQSTQTDRISLTRLISITRLYWVPKTQHLIDQKVDFLVIMQLNPIQFCFFSLRRISKKNIDYEQFNPFINMFSTFCNQNNSFSKQTTTYTYKSGLIQW